MSGCPYSLLSLSRGGSVPPHRLIMLYPRCATECKHFSLLLVEYFGYTIRTMTRHTQRLLSRLLKGSAEWQSRSAVLKAVSVKARDTLEDAIKKKLVEQREFRIKPLGPPTRWVKITEKGRQAWEGAK